VACLMDIGAAHDYLQVMIATRSVARSPIHLRSPGPARKSRSPPRQGDTPIGEKQEPSSFDTAKGALDVQLKPD